MGSPPRYHPASSIITYSSAEAYWRCPRAYHIAYVLKYRAIDDNPAAAIGTAVHAYAEKGTTPSLPDPYHEAKAQAMCALLDTLPSLRFHCREHTAMAKIPRVYMYAVAGKIDGITSDNRIYELKTVGGSLDAADATLRNSIQIPLYQHLVGNKEPAILDMVRKPSLRPRQGESPDEYRQRCVDAYMADPTAWIRRADVDYDERRVDEAVRYIAHAARAIRWSARNGWSRRYGAGCMAPWGPCEYKPLCWYGDETKYKHTDAAYGHVELDLQDA